jgi:ATP-dependent RNA helicase RhlE
MSPYTSRPGRHTASSGRRKTFSATPRHKRSGQSRSVDAAAHTPRTRARRSSFNHSSEPRAGSWHNTFHKNHRARNGARGKKMPTFNPAQFINTHPTTIEEVPYEPKHTFATFGLSDALVHTIHARGIKTPTPIQDQIIPHILAGSDVVGVAETGTGKTAAFLVPLIEKTLRDTNRQTLILTPTRELAIQIHDELKKLTGAERMFSTLCVGGTALHPQMKTLRMKNHFIIGTPGRVLDLIKRTAYQTAHTTTVVLDEADRMLDMGFIGDMKQILKTLPSTRETLLFSATMGPETERIVKDFLNNPIVVSVKKRDVTNSIEQDVVPYVHHEKFEKLTALFANGELKRVMIFGSMKHSVQKLAEELTAHGIKAEAIHGNKSHNARQRALNAFKSGNARVLVATDVAARGIHVDGVTHVINYDLPQTFDDYVHRIGRTGRGVHKGKALTFVHQ